MRAKGAVRTDAGTPIVLLVQNGKLERRAIKVGADRGADIEVIAGVAPGEMLVVRGGENLREGQAVEVKQ